MEVAEGRVDFYGYGKIALKPSANPIESTMIRTGIYFVKSEKRQKPRSMTPQAKGDSPYGHKLVSRLAAVQIESTASVGTKEETAFSSRR